MSEKDQQPNEGRDSDAKGANRYVRAFNTDSESFPQTQGQMHGTEFGFVESQPAPDNASIVKEHREVVPTPHFQHESRTSKRTVTDAPQPPPDV